MEVAVDVAIRDDVPRHHLCGGAELAFQGGVLVQAVAQTPARDDPGQTGVDVHGVRPVEHDRQVVVGDARDVGPVQLTELRRMMPPRQYARLIDNQDVADGGDCLDSRDIEAAIVLATDRIAASVGALLAHGGPDVLRELYARRRAHYQRYVERYFRGSWEEAILAWWHERTAVGQES